MSRFLSCHLLLPLLVLLVLGMNTSQAQTTEFTYQGKLVDGALPANANYDFEFRLFATASGGAAIASETRLGVTVANGIFTVSLDFGGQFDGNARWLEIGVKPGGSPNPLTVLTPRQPFTSTPHSIRSLSAARADQATNSLQLGGVNANQYVLTTDSRMTDARSPLPNSASYVQNTAAQQALTNFNISGNGTAGGTLSATAFNATTQYNINGNRILSNAGTFNLFAGNGAGAANTTGQSNSFFGRNAGLSNTAGGSNAFFGDSSGAANTSGDQNSFFGFFAGLTNTTGSRNSFFGYRAGQPATTGDNNAFFGYRAGQTNTTGSNNTFIGANADATSGNYNFATAIGSGATVNSSNTIVLGRGEDLVIASGGLFVDVYAFVSGNLGVRELAGGGITSVCRNGINYLATCSSSLRYKASVQQFSNGLDIVRRLRPITFNWKSGGMRDVGFAAEEVEKIEPLLVTYNDKGEIEGVKYGQLTTVLVNSLKQQQQIIERQQQQLDALKRLVCRSHQRAQVCR